jgi:hypothetical protein
MTFSDDKLWQLQCKNSKCEELFDYFGQLHSHKGISCTHCGQSSQYRFADFVTLDPAS